MHLSFCTKCFCFEIAIPLVNFQKYKMYEKMTTPTLLYADIENQKKREKNK